MRDVQSRPVAPVAAAIYSRISLDVDGEKFGIEHQIDRALKLAAGRGWTVAVDPALTCDNSISAAGAKRRPGFERLMELIETRQIGGVIVDRFDRIARNQREGVRFLEAAREAEVSVEFTSGGSLSLDNAMGQFVAEMMLSVSKLEIGIKAERQRVANRKRAENGDPFTSGTRPFGWSADKSSHHPVEADALAAAYDAVLAGATLRSIADRWNANPQLPPTQGGKLWTSTGVKRILLHPRNAGKTSIGGEVIADGSWEPLVDEDRFNAVTAILTAPGRSGPRTRGVKTLLGGIASCACGHPVFGDRTSQGKRRYRHKSRDGSTGHASQAADPIDELIEQLVVGRLAAPDAENLLVTEHSGPDAKELHVKRQALMARASEIASTFADPDTSMTRHQFEQANRKIQDRLAEVDAALAEASGSNVLTPLIAAGSSDTYDARVHQVHAVWEDLHIDSQRAVIEELFASITVHPANRTRGPFDPSTVQREWRRTV